MQLRQVLLNLLLNALDAVANEGHICVSVETVTRLGNQSSKSNPADTWVCLSVADDGCGLPIEQRERLFEPFFSTKDPGLGLGLAVSHSIIDAHGGELLAEERPQRGSVFKVLLPLSSPVAKSVPPSH